MNAETARDDWQDLSHVWQATGTTQHIDVPALRARIGRGQRRARLVLWLEVVITAVYLAAAVFLVRRMPSLWSWLVAADVLAMVIAAWTFALWNRRGTWRPTAESTEQYIALLRLHCVRRIQAAWFVWATTAGQVAFVLVIRSVVRSAGRPALALPAANAVGLPVITVLVFVAAAFRMRRQALRELRELDHLR